MNGYLGIDIGGTEVKLGVTDENLNLTAKDSFRTPQGGDTLCEAVAARAERLLSKSGLSALAVGVGVPGQVDHGSGEVTYACNLGLRHYPLGANLASRLRLPVQIGNDANLAALAENTLGAGRGAASLLMVTLGTGIGGGFVLDGKVFEGAAGCAAEVGHMVINYNGRRCACGRDGCFERYASASGLIMSTQEAMRQDRDSAMWELCAGDLHNANGRTAFEAARRGDRAGGLVVERYLDDLSCGLANLINILDPEVLCLGGGISREGDALLEPLRSRLQRMCYLGCKLKTRIVCAALGNDAGVVGAALLASRG